jgi:ribonuclease HI
MSEGILNRRMIFCDRLLSTHETDKLYRTCNDCDLFFCVCCQHYEDKPGPCHHYPIVFTDGACSKNGFGDAVSGIGVSCGSAEGYQWSIPVDEHVNLNPVRTNQRAELLAALEGVHRLGEIVQLKPKKCLRNSQRAEMVVATDSEYVCKGVSEWMPNWKVCAAPCCRCDMLNPTPYKVQWMAEQLWKTSVKQGSVHKARRSHFRARRSKHRCWILAD